MKLEDIQIAGCAIVQDRKEQVVPNVRESYSYFDYFVLVDGGSKDGLPDSLRQIDADNKINIFSHQWCDNFPVQRSYYLKYAGELRDPNKILWICRFDSDEYISIAFLQRIRKLILYAEQNKFDMLEIRAYDITVDKEGKEVSATLATDWHKGLVYKWYPHLKYVGANNQTVHEGYNHNFRRFRVPSKHEEYGLEGALVYKHIKTQQDVYERSSRNFYIDGGGPNWGEQQPLWKPFRELVDRVMPEKPQTYHDYINYLKQGNVHSDLKNWFILHMYEGESNKPQEWTDYITLRENEFSIIFLPSELGSFKSSAEHTMGYGYNGASEVKEAYKLYFRYLHPEEEPEELKELSIP